jgi:hypothetical protein
VAVAGGGLQAGGSFYGRKKLKTFEKKFKEVYANFITIYIVFLRH